MNLMWVVPGSHCEVAIVKGIHIQSAWMMENREKSRLKWILARFYCRSLGQGVLWNRSLTRSRSGYLDQNKGSSVTVINLGGFRGREVGLEGFWSRGACLKEAERVD